MAKNKKTGAIIALLIIVAVALLVFICWKAGWILTGDKNNLTPQEKQEAIQEAVDDLRDEFQDAREELRDEFQDAREDLQDVREDFQEAMDDMHDALQ